MRLSHHAMTRSQQRAVREDAIDLTLAFGRVRRGLRGTQVYQLDDRTLRSLPTPLASERLRGVTVVAVDDLVVTVYRDRPRRSTGRRIREAGQFRWDPSWDADGPAATGTHG